VNDADAAQAAKLLNALPPSPMCGNVFPESETDHVLNLDHVLGIGKTSFLARKFLVLYVLERSYRSVTLCLNQCVTDTMHQFHRKRTLKVGLGVSRTNAILSGIQFTTHFIDFFVVETTRFVGSTVNVILTRQTYGKRSSKAAESKSRALGSKNALAKSCEPKSKSLNGFRILQ